MNKLFYPAVFHEAEEGGFWVTFPDLPECFTEGDDMTQAYEMAFDALGLCLSSRETEKEPIPIPSNPKNITLSNCEFLVVIEFDMLSYRKRNSTAYVRKNVTIPEWLNEAALSMNVNFSQVLQEALTEIVSAKSKS